MAAVRDVLVALLPALVMTTAWARWLTARDRLQPWHFRDYSLLLALVAGSISLLMLNAMFFPKLLLLPQGVADFLNAHDYFGISLAIAGLIFAATGKGPGRIWITVCELFLVFFWHFSRMT
jgi:hypothetical protein